MHSFVKSRILHVFFCIRTSPYIQTHADCQFLNLRPHINSILHDDNGSVGELRIKQWIMGHHAHMCVQAIRIYNLWHWNVFIKFSSCFVSIIKKKSWESEEETKMWLWLLQTFSSDSRKKHWNIFLWRSRRFIQAITFFFFL